MTLIVIASYIVSFSIAKNIKRKDTTGDNLSALTTKYNDLVYNQGYPLLNILVSYVICVF